MATLQEQLNQIDSKIESNNAQAASLRASANDWRQQSYKDCTKQGYHPVFQKGKITECNVDKANKATKADQLDAQASAKVSENSNLLVSKKSIQALVEAEAKSQVSLAEQGKDSESLRIEADGNAKAAQTAAENISQAQARSIEVSANTDAASKAKEKNVQLIIIISIAGVGIAIFGLVLWKKFKKKKK